MICNMPFHLDCYLDCLYLNGQPMNFKMVHENYNVADLERSMAFYEKALGLHEVRRKNGEGFIIVYMGNKESDFELELTWLEIVPAIS